jgi:DNA repair exonuclease SbcCD ATPase subunit
MSQAHLVLPFIQRIQLRNFSLYSAEPIINISFRRGAFCLAGANGLGKSTFLSTLNYAVTGIVPDPERSFKSVSEYYRHSMEFSAEYFKGRITESDHDTAEVEVELSIGQRTYTLTRGFFEPEQLRSLQITDADAVAGDNTENHSAKARNDLYTKGMARDIGLGSFEQFVFLQHFVYTFDERRHLLFWDAGLLEQVLYLTFGFDPAQAQEADVLRREAEKADSLARNFNWQATEVRKKLDDLSAAVSNQKSVDEDLRGLHERLTEQVAKASDKVQRLQADADDVALKIAELSGQHATLRAQYDEAFAVRLKGKSNVTANPSVALSISDRTCQVCGSKGAAVVHSIQSRLEDHRCPLCDTGIVAQPNTSALSELKKIDRKLVDIRARLDEAVKSHSRRKNELVASAAELNTAKRSVSDFERKNAQALDQLLLQSKSVLRSTIQRYADQVEELLEKKKQQYQRRNENRRALAVIQKQLVKSYGDAEEEFVPSFKALAQLFLGLDLEVRLETGSTHGVWLALEVNSTIRRQFHQLSESQRFFIDIALRMALIQYMVGSGGCLLIDTPEGALDIAYESRAGKMFAKFAKKGSELILTANINTSRLLLSLAEDCGTGNMVLCRMTSWTQLSDVQLEEEELFEQAYSQIKRALDRGSAPKKGKRA